jgi:branched-chain amino acid transport system permease protein
MAAIAESGSGFRTLNVPAMIKEAGLTALVVFLLAIELVGFDTIEAPGGIALKPRMGDLAAAVAIAFVGRIIVVLNREGRWRAVLATTVPLSLLFAVLLLSDTIGQALGIPSLGRAQALLPFRAHILSWLMLVVLLYFALTSAIAKRRAALTLTQEERDEKMDRIGARVQRIARLLGPIMLVLALALPFLPFVDRRVLDIGVLVTTYVMLGWGLNIVVGLAGLLDLGYVAFYAVGAYSYALLSTTYDVSFWICLPFAGLMSATAGVLLGFPVLRLRGDYLAIVTLGFGEMVRVILQNWTSLSGGPNGIAGIPRPTFFGLSFSPDAPEGVTTFFTFFHMDFTPTARVVFLYYVILGLSLVTNFFTMRIRKLPIGRAWEALREDEIACRSLGINPRNTKLTAFGIGAMFAGFAGSFFATRQGFISPESFTFIESAVILAIVVLGGMGSQIGVVFAAIILIGMPEIFRDLQQFRMLAFGAAMVGIMLWRPAGLLAHREPTLRLYPHGQPRGRER